MGRIRSIHPGLFTDEAFVTVSEIAQIFFVGLLVESDDQGVFEWKPVTLRLRLRGNKDGPVEPILSELVGVDSIRSYELDGRKYGAIRNFCKYQRPKKPNAVHPIIDEIRTYVALGGRSSEPEPDEGGSSTELDAVEAASVPPKAELNLVQPPSVPQKSELGPLMEDGGGKRKDGKGTSSLRSDSAEAAKRSTQSLALVPEISAFIALETNVRGENFIVTEALVADVRELYPAVDVEQQFRSMRGWLTANPTKRKTAKGMLSFIHKWLAREQNKGHFNGKAGHDQGGPDALTRGAIAAAERYRNA